MTSNSRSLQKNLHADVMCKTVVELLRLVDKSLVSTMKFETVITTTLASYVNSAKFNSTQIAIHCIQYIFLNKTYR